MILIALTIFFAIGAVVTHGLAAWLRYETRQRRREK